MYVNVNVLRDQGYSAQYIAQLTLFIDNLEFNKNTQELAKEIVKNVEHINEEIVIETIDTSLKIEDKKIDVVKEELNLSIVDLQNNILKKELPFSNDVLKSIDFKMDKNILEKNLVNVIIDKDIKPLIKDSLIITNRLDELPKTLTNESYSKLLGKQVEQIGLLKSIDIITENKYPQINQYIDYVYKRNPEIKVIENKDNDNNNVRNVATLSFIGIQIKANELKLPYLSHIQDVEKLEKIVINTRTGEYTLKGLEDNYNRIDLIEKKYDDNITKEFSKLAKEATLISFAKEINNINYEYNQIEQNKNLALDEKERDKEDFFKKNVSDNKIPLSLIGLLAVSVEHYIPITLQKELKDAIKEHNKERIEKIEELIKLEMADDTSLEKEKKLYMASAYMAHIALSSRDIASLSGSYFTKALMGKNIDELGEIGKVVNENANKKIDGFKDVVDKGNVEKIEKSGEDLKEDFVKSKETTTILSFTLLGKIEKVFDSISNKISKEDLNLLNNGLDSIRNDKTLGVDDKGYMLSELYMNTLLTNKHLLNENEIKQLEYELKTLRDQVQVQEETIEKGQEVAKKVEEQKKFEKNIENGNEIIKAVENVSENISNKSLDNHIENSIPKEVDKMLNNCLNKNVCSIPESENTPTIDYTSSLHDFRNNDLRNYDPIEKKDINNSEHEIDF